MKKQTKIYVGVGVILAAMAFLMFTAFSGSSMYYVTVDEALARGAEVQGKNIRLSGDIIQDSIQFDIKIPELKFKVRGKQGGQLTIVYNGVKPDNMVEATQAIAEGVLDSKGVFRANKLMLSCPSKYEGGDPTMIMVEKPGPITRVVNWVKGLFGGGMSS